MGHVRLKNNWSNDRKPCVHPRSHIFSPILMKLGQNVCLNNIWNYFENWSCQVKNYVTRSKKLLYALEAIFSAWCSWNLVRMFATIKPQTTSKMGHVRSKNRSLGQIIEKPCLCSRGHTFSPILMKLGQNIFPSEILDKCENGLCWVKNLVKSEKKKKKSLYTLEARFSVSYWWNLVWSEFLPLSYFS